MRKSRTLRLVGFVGALTASAALVATTAATTGAYFSDSKTGTVTANSGHLTLKVGADAQLNMNFPDLWPGETKDQHVDYTIDSSHDGVDLWLVFDPTSEGFQALTGGSDSPLWNDGGMGRYGYFKVSDTNGGRAFRSGNLKYPAYTGTAGSNNQYPANGSCDVDPLTGRGGSDWIADESNQGNTNTTTYCGIPTEIRLASDLGKSATGTFTMTFGLDGYMQTEQNQLEPGGTTTAGSAPTVDYKLVATQHGQRP